MASSAEQLNTLRDEYVTAVGNAAWDDALTICRKALGILAMSPDLERTGDKIEWGREQIKSCIDEIKIARKETALNDTTYGGIIQQTPYQHDDGFTDDIL